MPKTTLPAFPISALFGITKPSGPSSMAVINDLKRLVSTSRLFMDASVAQANSEKVYVEGGAEGNRVNNRNLKGGREKGKWKRAKGRSRDVEAKMGQGGTLDPLADGVLVVGVNKGTKRLGDFLDCVKEYRTTCLLGCETDTYDSEGAQVRTASWRQVTKESVEAALEQFQGNIQQTPPVFSALKMDGKPLYEYAREGIPLPRPIERRPVTVHSLEVTHWIRGSDHSYDFPAKKFTDDERGRMEKALRGVEIPANAVIKDEPEQGSAAATVVSESSKGNEEDGKSHKDSDETETARPPAFVLTMRVSGGTYVRSIVHDLGHAVGSAAHVVTLTRSRQGRFVLAPSDRTSTPILPDPHALSADTSVGILVGETSAEASGSSENDQSIKIEPEEHQCIPWDVFARALDNGASEEPDADGWREWEREVMQRLEVVEGK